MAYFNLRLKKIVIDRKKNLFFFKKRVFKSSFQICIYQVKKVNFLGSKICFFLRFLQSKNQFVQKQEFPKNVNFKQKKLIFFHIFYEVEKAEIKFSLHNKADFFLLDK